MSHPKTDRPMVKPSQTITTVSRSAVGITTWPTFFIEETENSKPIVNIRKTTPS